MITVSISDFSKNIYNILNRTIKLNEPIIINTKNGNAVVLSEKDFNGLIETLYFTNMPEVKQSIIEGLNTPVEDCFDEKAIKFRGNL